MKPAVVPPNSYDARPSHRDDGVVPLESVCCPIGCPPGDDPVITGFDRLTGQPGRYQVVRCQSCGLMRTNPRPIASAMSRFYPDDYAPYLSSRPTASTASTSPWRRLLDRALPTRNRELPRINAGHLLEIGCGSGGFMQRMSSSGWSVEGIEFSPAAASVARANGYQVHVGPLEDAPPPSRPPTLIVGWMVLEHLHQPVLALRKLREWATDECWLALSVPDAGAFERRLFGDAWFALQLPTHLYHYTPQSARRVLAAGGWSLERIIWHDNAKNALQSLAYVLGDRGWARCARYVSETADGHRHRYLRLLLGKLLGALRQSGRMTLWARATR